MASESSASVYRREGDHTLIEIRLREIRQLFHTLDPAPFREKDLDEGAEDYLIEACREAGSRRPLRLIVCLPAEALLYDWWPLARRRALLRQLAAIPIEVRGAP